MPNVGLHSERVEDGMAHTGRQPSRALSGAAILVLCTLAVLCLGLAGCADSDSQDEGDDVAPATALDFTRFDDAVVEALLSDMTLEQKVAQLFIVRPESLVPTGGDVTVASDELLRALAQNPPAGLCYFAENIQNPSQTRELLAATQQAASASLGLPLFQSVDEEGGQVARIANNPAMGVDNIGSARHLGSQGDAQAAYDAASYVASYLADLGFNMDFAPDADVASADGNAIGVRSFGTTPQEVSPMVIAQVGAFGDAGVICSVKHFPGLGGAVGDSHYQGVTTGKTLDELLGWDLVPFRDAIDGGSPLVMVGHLSCPQVTGSDEPASFSHTMVTLVLRLGLRYDGLVVTDSLEMAAAGGYAPEEQGVRAIAAGCDLVLMPIDYQAACQGVLDAVRNGAISEEAIDSHVARVLRAKLALPGALEALEGQA